MRVYQAQLPMSNTNVFLINHVIPKFINNSSVSHQKFIILVVSTCMILLSNLMHDNSFFQRCPLLYKVLPNKYCK